MSTIAERDKPTRIIIIIMTNLWFLNMMRDMHSDSVFVCLLPFFFFNFFVQVDIYGFCGDFKCPRSSADKCFEVLDHDYKFYLAFENSNCKDYITEKFFVNALGRNILPIVMGGRPEVS